MKLPFITFLLGGRGNIINVMPQMANLGKGCLKLGQATCLYIFLYGAPWDILHIFFVYVLCLFPLLFLHKTPYFFASQDYTKGQILEWTMEDISNYTITPI